MAVVDDKTQRNRSFGRTHSNGQTYLLGRELQGQAWVKHLFHFITAPRANQGHTYQLCYSYFTSGKGNLYDVENWNIEFQDIL